MMKKAMLALACTLAMGAAHADVLLVENFDNVDALPGQGWVFENASQPPGVAPGWVMGNVEVFGAQDDPDTNNYIASDFNNAAPGGFIDNRLFTPLFSLENGAVASFWLRGALDPDFFDMVAYGYTDGSTNPLEFTVQADTIAPEDWTRYTLTIGAQAGMGRLGFVHFGQESTSTYVGLDTLRIDTLEVPSDVPEPASLLILGIGMAGLAASRRRPA